MALGHSRMRQLLHAAALDDPEKSPTPVLTCACVGFPLGANRTSIKALEAAACVQDGAQEIDMVIALPTLLAADLSQAHFMISLKSFNPPVPLNKNTVIKVILETAILNEEQIALGCHAAHQAGANFVKTSTGFHPKGGATIQFVTLLKKYAAGMKVKAAGGIRDLPTAQAMLAAGADRLGCSASVAIVTRRQ